MKADSGTVMRMHMKTKMFFEPSAMRVVRKLMKISSVIEKALACTGGIRDVSGRVCEDGRGAASAATRSVKLGKRAGEARMDFRRHVACYHFLYLYVNDLLLVIHSNARPFEKAFESGIPYLRTYPIRRL